MGSRRIRTERRSCLTWPIILVLVVLLVVGGIMIWAFAPWDDAINGVLDDVRLTGGGSTLPPTRKPVVVATFPPTAAPPYEFMQCDPNNTGQSDCCNGVEGACDLRANEIMYATLHNAMATLDGGFLFGPNHKTKLEGALEAGYRGLNLDICNCGGELVFCHGLCSLGPRDVVEVMQNVNAFLDEHPTEVITFIYQIDNDADQRVDLNQFYDKMLLVDGFVEKIYVHEGADAEWPTLRQLTEPMNNKRVIMFHYNGPNCNADPAACPDGLHLYYNYASDNNWEHMNVASIENRLNSCELRNNGINNNIFVGLNNFVSPPSQTSAQTLNDHSAATAFVDACTELLRTDINFVLVDFWEDGDLPKVTQEHNTALARQRRNERKLLRRE